MNFAGSSKRVRYPWGVESPTSRKKRLLSRLAEINSSIRLTREQIERQLVEVSDYLLKQPRRQTFAEHQSLQPKVPIPTAIYAIKCPSTGEVRYVGKTLRPLETRLRQHLVDAKKAKTHLHRWLDKLVQAGMQPVIEVLEVVPPFGNWVEAERKWILYWRKKTSHITNIATGGQGVFGLTHSATTRKRLSESTKAYMRLPENRRRQAGNVPFRKLSDDDALQILEKFLELDGRTSQIELASIFNVPQNAVSRIIHGATFSWLTDDAKRQRAQELQRRRARKLSDEEIRQLLTEYIRAAGRESMATVGARYGVTYSTVHEIVKGKLHAKRIPPELTLEAQRIAREEAGRVSKRRQLTFEQAQAIRLAHDAGKSLGMLAIEYGISKKAILNIVANRTYVFPD